MRRPHVPSPRDVSRAVVRSAAPFSVVVVASSLGGIEALGEMLKPLPRELPVPILIVQHLTRGSRLPELLERRTGLPVQWAAVTQSLSPGHVYVAPPGRHLLVCRPGQAETRLGDKVNFTCPAADPLFFSAARHYAAQTLGVVLSGRLSDGAAGAQAIRAAGGAVIVQEPESCAASSMPIAAIRSARTRVALPPSSVGHAIVGLTMTPGVSALLGIRSN